MAKPLVKNWPDDGKDAMAYELVFPLIICLVVFGSNFEPSPDDGNVGSSPIHRSQDSHFTI